MYIKKLLIKNFRGIRKAELCFEPGINFLIGTNNIGKSTILKAIDFLLNPSIQWWRNDRLTELDFWRKEINNELIVEAIICCGYKTCTGENDSCPYFEFGEDIIETCKLSQFSLFYDKYNLDNPFPNIEDLEDSENIELAIRIRMIGTYQEEENYFSVKHEIFGNDGEWHSFTRSMKEFIGANLFTSFRDPNSNFRLQYNSLLIKFFKNINKTKSKIISQFKKGLKSIIDKIYDEELRELFKEHQDLLNEFPDDTSICLGLGKVRDFEILRQIELSLKYFSEEMNNFEIPLSFQGRGLQNLLFLFLCSRIQSIQVNSPKIFLIEEPEQNLEPQRQRSIIKIIKNLVNDDSQIIITTHSPFILVLNKNLAGVKKIVKKLDDMIEFVDLGRISANNKYFKDIRKQCDSDLELFESLFSNFIVLWEGDCELSFYTTIMRNLDDFPSEWLIGINCQGDNIKNISKWLKNANYDILAIIDGDKSDLLNDLKNENIPFIALREDEKFENIIEECLNKLDDDDCCEILIKMIGARGYISHFKNIIRNWTAFQDTFNDLCSLIEDQNEKYKFKIETLKFLSKFRDDHKNQKNKKPQNLIYILENLKDKRSYEILAEYLIEKQSLTDVVFKLLEKMKNIFFKIDNSGFYQLNNQNEFLSK
ncbi:MAG: ATP-dependent nuclease [Promethearchaeota archaeon]